MYERGRSTMPFTFRDQVSGATWGRVERGVDPIEVAVGGDEGGESRKAELGGGREGRRG